MAVGVKRVGATLVLCYNRGVTEGILSMIENNAVKGELNLNSDFSGVKADFTPTIEIMNDALLYVVEQLGKPLVGSIRAKLFSFVENKVSPKIFAIPEENRISPNLRIAKGVFENVINLEENEVTLQEMFANLLAGSMDNRKSDGVHPSYAKLISELSEKDARFLVGFYNNTKEQIIPYLITNNGELRLHEELKRILSESGYFKDGNLFHTKELLCSKGLIREEFLSNDFSRQEENWVDVWYRTQEKELKESNLELTSDRNLLLPTVLGQHFIQAVKVKEAPTDEKS